MATTTLGLELETYRGELTAYCYRMLASNFEAEDAVQETFIRAWTKIDSFEGRSALRSWLYSIATNVCIDMLRSSQRRARAIDLGPASTADVTVPARTANEMWIEPLDDARVLGIDADPAELAEHRESVRLAFVAALQHLPPRQRAVLILREVLRWQASEVAELLETSVASVNSALQRARATLEGIDRNELDRAPHDEEQRELLERYASAFERYDIDSLVTLLHDEVKFSMPPYPMWLQGPDDVGTWMLTRGIACKGSRLVATSANGCPAFAQYRRAEPGIWEPWSIQVLEISDGKIVQLHNFLDTNLFRSFGLPPRLTD